METMNTINLTHSIVLAILPQVELIVCIRSCERTVMKGRDGGMLADPIVIATSC
jgi:hypothetical protein